MVYRRDCGARGEARVGCCRERWSPLIVGADRGGVFGRMQGRNTSDFLGLHILGHLIDAIGAGETCAVCAARGRGVVWYSFVRGLDGRGAAGSAGTPWLASHAAIVRALPRAMLIATVSVRRLLTSCAERGGSIASETAVHICIESGDGGEEVQTLSVDVAVVVADDWIEASCVRVTTRAKCIATLSYLARLAALHVSANGIAADICWKGR